MTLQKYIFIAIAIIAVCATINYCNLRNSEKQSEIKPKIESKKKEIDSLKLQKKQSDNAQLQSSADHVSKSTKQNKTTKYEKIIIADADFSAIADTLAKYKFE